MRNIPEFRSNMREAFNEAEAGQSVYIERFGKIFELVHRKNFQHDEHGVKIVIPFNKPTAPPLHDRQVLTAEDGSTATVKNNSVATPLDQAVERKKQNSDVKFCKAGHILASNGKCLQKGCKYA